MEDLIAKIQGMTLSKTESQIADYILEHLDVIGLPTARLSWVFGFSLVYDRAAG